MSSSQVEASVAVESVLPADFGQPRHLELASAFRRARRWPISAALSRDLTAVLRPFLGSRLLIYGVGALTMLLAGVGTAEWSFDPNDLTTSFGPVGNLLAASAVRWDSIYYLHIAQHGYAHIQDAAFFPLYPMVVRLVAFVLGSYVISGALVSLTALLATLVIVRRLTVLELGEQTANLTVRLLAFGPMAVFLSAVYTESLFLALTSGAFYAGRRGRWATAGILGGLAAGTRSGGILLLPSLLILFLWGPREDLSPRDASSRWKPRYRLSVAGLWLLLIPLGSLAVNLNLVLQGLGPAASLRAQETYHNHAVTLPFVGLWRGLVAGWQQVELICTGTPLTSHPSQALFQCVVLLVTIAALIGVFRRLPLAYGVYALLGTIVLHLSVPTAGDPLAGFARYASLRFPLFMFAALWAVEHRRSRVVLVGFAALAVLFTVQFANWQVVGTPTL